MNSLDYKRDKSLVSNIFGFLRLPLEFDPYHTDSDWVITGIPFDLATSGRSGSRHGPTAIRQASVNLAWEGCRWPWKFDVRQEFKIVDCGDLVFNFGDSQDLTEKLLVHSEQLLFAGKKMLSFGGDHYVTLPVLRAYKKYFGKLAIVDFDAHTDTYVNYNKYDHGSVFLHALHEDLIDPRSSVQIGIRTECKKDNCFVVLNAEEVNDSNIKDVLNKVKQIVGIMPVYLTFDIDCLDPSAAPGTGTPVIGGLTTGRALKLLRGLHSLNIVGMDIVEVSPSYDYAQITALAAATLALEMLYITLK